MAEYSTMNLAQVRYRLKAWGVELLNTTMPNGDIVLAPHDYVDSPKYKCGPNKHKLLTFLIPDKIYFNRQSACAVHDFMYQYPLDGTIGYKELADDLFLINMEKLALRREAAGNLPSFLATPMNKVYYWFVKYFGSKAFFDGK